jgi:hypothetical protein
VSADDGQQACCRACGRTPLACAKTVAPECLDMQRRLVLSAQNAGFVQYGMSLSVVVAECGPQINDATNRILMKGVAK